MGSAEVIFSFRGVAKYVSVLNTTTGKNHAIHEFGWVRICTRGECLLGRAEQPHQVAGSRAAKGRLFQVFSQR